MNEGREKISEVLASYPTDVRIDVLKELCNMLDIASIRIDKNLTGTRNDPFPNEVVIVSYERRTEDVTEYLTYDNILKFMNKELESGKPLFKKDIVKARNVMVAVWKGATEVLYDSDLRVVWKEPNVDWQFKDTKSAIFSELMARGPKGFKICCNDPNLDSKATEHTFWDIVFNDSVYEIFARYWLA
jgi:hypothetical protein